MQANAFQISYSLSSIANAAHQFWQFAHLYRVIAFEGNMGAGKTTFCATLAHVIHTPEQLSSPTFAIMNEYALVNDKDGYAFLAHMDWYRLRDEEEAIAAGMENILTDNNYRCWIEWPSNAAGILPQSYLQVNIAMGDNDDERILSAVVKV